MEHHKLLQNEAYFTNVMNTLADGGVFCWKDLGENLVKRGGKFQVSVRVMEALKDIVTREYLKNNFELNP